MSRFRVDDSDADQPPPSRRARRRPARDDDDVPPEVVEPIEVRLSTYQDSRAAQGPRPVPDWLVTSAGALDHDRGPIKTGKEADVALVERVDPTTGQRCLLARKRYRTGAHRLFHRDAGYREGRQVRRSRENRAMATRTDFGRQLIAGQWAAAEFETLGWLWSDGIPVPYPVQIEGTSLDLEFIGSDDGIAAPRLAETSPSAGEAEDWLEQCRRALRAMVAVGYTHGDLSPYNVLVDQGRIVFIDLPQVVDVVGNPQGAEFLRRDCRNLGGWFVRRGVTGFDPDAWADELWATAGRG